MQTILNKSIVPLIHALICLDCNCVTDANGSPCVFIMNLSSVLNRRNMWWHSVKRVAA
jgi:hypothetical protein